MARVEGGEGGAVVEGVCVKLPPPGFQQPIPDPSDKDPEWRPLTVEDWFAMGRDGLRPVYDVRVVEDRRK